MLNIQQKLVPTALLTAMSSRFLYGAPQYVVTSTEGGPVSDEIGGVISYAEAVIAQKLAFESTIIEINPSTAVSTWVDADGNELFPRGTNTAVVKFTVTNVSDKPVDIHGMYIKAWFEDNEWLAAPVCVPEDMKHTQLGFPEHLVDKFPINSTEWLLQPGESIDFAETFYVESTDHPLNVAIVVPTFTEETGKASASEIFQLYC